MLIIFQVSLAARQLINALLQRDPANRLGSKNGAIEIKQHPFFRGINWPLIRCMVIIPNEDLNNDNSSSITDVSLLTAYAM